MKEPKIILKVEEKRKWNEQLRGLISATHEAILKDYKNDFDRGTVEYNFQSKNYSFHKVVIPNGTIIKEANFTQKEPHTDCIAGKNLTFIECNLVNVELDPTWTVIDCNTAQIRRVPIAPTNKIRRDTFKLPDWFHIGE